MTEEVAQNAVDGYLFSYLNKVVVVVVLLLLAMAHLEESYNLHFLTREACQNYHWRVYDHAPTLTIVGNAVCYDSTRIEISTYMFFSFSQRD